MKRTWVLVTVLLATVGGPATAAMARPISTYSFDSSISNGAGTWSGDVQFEVDEQGLAYLRVNLSRMVYVNCGGSGMGLDTERVTYDAATSGVLAVERKLASMTFTSAQPMEWTSTDGCTGATTSHTAVTAVTLDTLATGDLNRGRTSEGRLLTRMSNVVVNVGAAQANGTLILQELITKG